MTEQRPEDNNQTPTDEPGDVWVDNSASGLTDEPGGVWVDPPGIDPDRLGAMIREQDGVTDHVGDVHQEPNVGGVPQPGSAEQQIHSLNLSSAYEEATPPNPTFDSAYDQIIPTAPHDPIDSAYDQNGEKPINVVVRNPQSPDEEPPEPPYEFEAPVGSPDYEAPDDFESPYGAFKEPPGANIPDLVEQPTPPAPPLQFDSYSTEASYVTTGLSSVTDDSYLTDPSLMEDPTTADQNDQDQDFGGGF